MNRKSGTCHVGDRLSPAWRDAHEEGASSDETD